MTPQAELEFIQSLGFVWFVVVWYLLVVMVWCVFEFYREED